MSVDNYAGGPETASCVGPVHIQTADDLRKMKVLFHLHISMNLATTYLKKVTMSRLLWPSKSSFIWLLTVTSNFISASNVITADITTSDGPPPPLTTGCLNNSLTAPTWTVESFRYEEDDSISTVNFILTGNSIPEELDCFGQAAGHSRGAIGECTDQGRKDVHSSQFMFDASTRDLSIKQAWACDDNAARLP